MQRTADGVLALVALAVVEYGKDAGLVGPPGAGTAAAVGVQRKHTAVVVEFVVAVAAADDSMPLVDSVNAPGDGHRAGPS